MTGTPRIEVRDLSKAYGGVIALEGVSLDIRKGEVHALCGENGAGKSTLNKILSGSVMPDKGQIILEGTPLAFGNIAMAEKAGVAIVHQESVAFPHLNAVDNIFLMHEKTRFKGLWLDRPVMRATAIDLLKNLGESFDVDCPLEDLTLAQRQMVGIARALLHRCKLLILDEPTASLSSRETEALFSAVRHLRDEGVSILYVSHRLEEIFALADRVTILRDGRHVATRNVAETNQGELIGLMVGRAVERVEGRGSGAKGMTLLHIRNLTRAGQFRDVSFQVNSGEIVALAGLVGAGRSELARALFGLEKADSGEVSTFPENPKPAIAYLPEDRQEEGLHLPLSIRQNLSMVVLTHLSKAGFVSTQAERQNSQTSVKELGIRAPNDQVPVESLSGGNQQKTLFGKWLATDPGILILDEPTRGVDVGSKAEIHQKIRDFADGGAGVLVISSELPEVLALADRILVMRQGRISGELKREDATQEKILALALPSEDQLELGRNRRRSLPRELGIGVLLLLLGIGVGLANPAFLAFGNLRDILVKLSPTIIVASGLTFVILAREIDISVGSLMGLCSATLGVACAADRLGLPATVGVALCLGVGAAGGLLNGVLVAFGKIPSIIVTLGMLTILSGITELMLGGKWITSMPGGLREFGTGSWMGVPYSVSIAILAALVALWISIKTSFGGRIYALGSNPSAAEAVGLPSKKIRLGVFMLTGLLTGIAALFSATQLQVIESGFGKGFELTVVAAVVVGGTSIRGGRGTIFGSVIGAALLGVIGTMLIFLRLGESSTYWERAIQGGLILLAVLADHLSRRKGVTR